MTDGGASNDPPASERSESAPLDSLFLAVYAELREIAHHRQRQMGRGGTLNTTALVREAYLKLARLSVPTVKRDWSRARGWLVLEMDLG